MTAGLLSHRLGGNLNPGFVDLGRDDDVGLLTGLITHGTHGFSISLSRIGLFQRFGLGHLFSSHRQPFRFGLFLPPVGIGIRHGDFGSILTFYGSGIGPGYFHPLFLHRLGLPDGTITVLLRHTDLGIVDRLGSSFLSQGLDIPRLVVDIRHIDVDQLQTDLLQLSLHIRGYRRQKLVAVAVDLLNIHGGHHQPQLSENDVLGQIADVGDRQPQQPLGCIGHDPFLRRNTHRKPRGHIHPDVLLTQGTGQVDLNRKGCQIEK